MEEVAVHHSSTGETIPFKQQLVAGINDTTFYTGFFGLGNTLGDFDGVVARGPIAALSEDHQIIPSRSYGYTAGAYYGKYSSSDGINTDS